LDLAPRSTEYKADRVVAAIWLPLG